MEKTILSKLENNLPLKVTINSDDIDFKDGYGVASYNRDYHYWDESDFFGKWIDVNGDFRGIVDENLDEILPFRAYNLDIKNFGQSNFIITKRYTGGDGEQKYTFNNSEHIRIVDGKVVEVTDLQTSRYRVISDKSIIIDGRIYNLTNGSFSEEFSTIEEFKQVGENSENILARAVVFLEYGHELVCYIDTKGEIRTPLLSSFDGESLEINNPEFNLAAAIARINEKIKEDIDFKKNLNDKLIALS